MAPNSSTNELNNDLLHPFQDRRVNGRFKKPPLHTKVPPVTFTNLLINPKSF